MLLTLFSFSLDKYQQKAETIVNEIHKKSNWSTKRMKIIHDSLLIVDQIQSEGQKMETK